MIQTFIDHVWQSTAFAGVAGLLTVALRKNRAAVRYWLWLAASLKFLAPFSLLVTIGGYLSPFVGPIAAPTTAAVSRTVLRIAQPFSNGIPDRAAPTIANAWIPLIVAIWCCGIVLLAIVRWRAWRDVQVALRASQPLAREVGRKAAVDVRSSARLFQPGVVGIWRPVILLPSGVDAHLTTTQLQAVLAHEACHVRRRDNLTAAIHMIVEAIFWFHPAVWWIGAQLLKERERACDEQVLRTSAQPRAYAEAILTVCKFYVEPPLACVSGVTGSHLTKRIEDIMIGHVGLKMNFARKCALVVTATAALSAPVIVGLMTTPILAQARSQGAGQPAAKPSTKEAELRTALFEMRDAIDTFYKEKSQYPRSLRELVTQGYLKTIPTDPFTNSSTSWQTVQSKRDTKNPTAATGIFDVKSGSKGTATDGTKYSSW